jgi:hypothetical protein
MHSSRACAPAVRPSTGLKSAFISQATRAHPLLHLTSAAAHSQPPPSPPSFVSSRIVPISPAVCFRHLSYFDALCAAVDQAKHSVWMETCVARPLTLKQNLSTKPCRYIMKGDALGNRLLAKLDAAAGNHRRRTVRCNLFARSRRAQRAASTCGW